MQEEVYARNIGKSHLFSNAINFFKKWFIDEKKEITEALLFNNSQKAIQIIKKYSQTHTPKEVLIFINTPTQYGDTLLETSLNSRLYDCSALLLELGANPNKYLKNGEWESRLQIKNSLTGGDPTIYLLLSLYGGSIEGINPDNATKKANKIMQTHIDRVKNELQPIGEKRIRLMQLANNLIRQHQYQEAAKVYQEVADIWSQANKIEKVSAILKDFYHQQSLDFQKKAVELSQTYSVPNKESFSTTPTLHHRKDEQRSLTASPNKF